MPSIAKQATYIALPYPFRWVFSNTSQTKAIPKSQSQCGLKIESTFKCLTTFLKAAPTLPMLLLSYYAGIVDWLNL